MNDLLSIDVAGPKVVAVQICSPESSLHHQAFVTSCSISAMDVAMKSTKSELLCGH
ncbi:hypothetical protein Bca4012_089484 [Brassica carinata]|uniref:Uncharacterized protein n=1 Tax=Brassica cretica TaxID=69181 RepID=A0ABQ7B815_BRACR|nr:hypothetical protein DY000_02041020 [Brassica cretica]